VKVITHKDSCRHAIPARIEDTRGISVVQLPVIVIFIFEIIRTKLGHIADIKSKFKFKPWINKLNTLQEIIVESFQKGRNPVFHKDNYLSWESQRILLRQYHQSGTPAKQLLCRRILAGEYC
jgi:hypothetical protein